ATALLPPRIQTALPLQTSSPLQSEVERRSYQECAGFGRLATASRRSFSTSCFRLGYGGSSAAVATTRNFPAALTPITNGVPAARALSLVSTSTDAGSACS